jgi:hypothetical protein
MGYLYKSGSSSFHKFGDLPYRLIKRDPGDRGAVMAMVEEYRWRKPIPEFEHVLFQGLESASKDPRWRFWDDMGFARAHFYFGQKNQKKDRMDVALRYARKALARTPPGWDPAWIKEWIAHIEKAAAHPRLGMPKTFSWVDDIAP